ncbi:DMT family transporter [Acetobacteraceae bacterium H6797]|nr:DMT family transporter [Acetobacteraceae bacterium H6797]
MPTKAFLTPVRLGLLGALVTVAIWTAWITASRMAMGSATPLDPSLLAFIRFGTAAVLLAPLWWRFRLIPRGSSPLALLGLLMAGLPYQFLVLQGFYHAPAAEGGPLLTGSLPLFIALLQALLLRERLGLGRIVGVTLITAGVACILGMGLLDIGAGTWRGHLLILAAAFSWSVYTIAFRYSGLSGLQAAAFVGLWSVLLLLPFAGFRILDALQATPGAVLAQQFVVQGLLAGVIALLTYMAALKHLGAARTTAVTALVPVTITIAAVLFLGESPRPIELLGCAAVVLGVLVTSGVLGLPRLIGRQMPAPAPGE